MLLLFSVRVAESPLAWERAVHSVYLACLLTFISCVCVCVCVCVCGLEGGVLGYWI